VTEGAQAELPELSGFSPKQVSRLSRASRLVLPAAEEALAMAGLLDAGGCSSMKRLELSVSTTACGMEKGEDFLHSLWKGESSGHTARVAHYQAQQQIGEIQRRFGFRGPAMMIANACAGGGNAIGHAADLIRAGMADIVLAGGYDALCDLVFTGFDSLQALAPDACRPFDRGRRGLMVGEGAAFLVVESERHALGRGATLQGVVAGYGQATDTFHLTQPAQDGAPLERAMRQALANARITPGEVGYVNAHGTGTPFNDGAEAKAFHALFGGVPTKLSSTKAALGHTLGAAGAIEGVLSLLALKSGCLPPQINLLDPEPLVADALVRERETATLHSVMSVNLGFGGSNAALVFSNP
jgi:3-oxoacyl-[acyl-carrier-protein] synthase II